MRFKSKGRRNPGPDGLTESECHRHQSLFMTQYKEKQTTLSIFSVGSRFQRLELTTKQTVTHIIIRIDISGVRVAVKVVARP